MSDWMALWTRMNTFPPSRYRCATDIVKVERISQFLFDLAQYLALFRTGRIPIRVCRREVGKGCWGHLWLQSSCILIFFFFNDTATTEIYTLSLHDALPI